MELVVIFWGSGVLVFADLWKGGPLSAGVELDANGPIGSDTLDFEVEDAAEEEGKGARAVKFRVKDLARARRERDLCPTCTLCISEATTVRRKEIKRAWMKRV